jgi:hypothetical protein
LSHPERAPARGGAIPVRSLAAAEPGAAAIERFVGTSLMGIGAEMQFLLLGLLLAALIFLATGGHLLFLPLFFILPLGGLFGGRWRRRGS